MGCDGMNWNKAQTLMESARDKSKGKHIAHNTRLYDNDGYYHIRLHNNVIMEIYPDYTQLHDAGWRTVTTKARLNQFSSVSVYQRDFDWYVRVYPYIVGTDEPFINGMVIDYE